MADINLNFMVDINWNFLCQFLFHFPLPTFLSRSPNTNTIIAVNHKWQWLYSCFHKTCFLRFLQMHNKSISGSLYDVIRKIEEGELKGDRDKHLGCRAFWKVRDMMCHIAKQHKSEHLCHGDAFYAAQITQLHKFWM